MHLLIPFAFCDAPGCLEALRALRLGHLPRLLQRLAPLHRDEGTLESLSPPHERSLARHQGLAAADGCIPWAAQEAGLAGLAGADQAWAWIFPAHWDVAAHHIAMADPQALELDGTQSRALLAAMEPYFAEDGITLLYAQPERWLARGPVFDGLATASLDRVVGQDIRRWMPGVPTLRRLQSEMQMLLYTHAVTEQRSARGLPVVNSFWVSGSGRLPASRAAPSGTLHTADGLRQPALRGDWTAWATAWQTLDAQEGQRLAQALDGGADVRLTLCGPRHALTLAPARGSLIARLRRRWQSPGLTELLEAL